ncbi:MAG: hypothetical protein PHP79_06220, partial [Clostridia bacterium]|nr:hypothetical protein [Clostridia bacterium]
SFDNIIFEVMNEPWVTNVETLWQEYIAETIADTEKSLPVQHLISWNPANGFMLVENPNKNVSVYNFHYASPPEAIRVNYHLARPIGCNETGFAGQSDFAYRSQAWDFILGGGALFNNLDYSFTVGHENGDFQYPETQPGGGSNKLRKQYKILADFINSFDFIHMKPADDLIKGLRLSNGFGRLLAQPGKAYALYVSNATDLRDAIDILPDHYHVEWVSPITGDVEGSSIVDHSGGIMHLSVPKPQKDIALKIKAASHKE